ncbi:MAG: hypothetical protein ACTMUB_10215 [cyanobacterium endosymbiont of Rhopalodia musculus]
MISLFFFVLAYVWQTYVGFN